jgi:transposase InsO family protein
MPWKVSPVSEIRLAFVHQVLSLGVSVAQAARDFGISRKTAYKWIDRYRARPKEALSDHSRRPASSPGHTSEDVEQQALNVREQYGWGARKIRAYLADRGVTMPSVRTVTNILRRNGRITSKAAPEPIQFYERSEPHQLWQCDHKGPLEVGRRKVHPFTVLDDHSRYLIACHTCLDVSMKPVFQVLWNAFGEFGLPEAILCDNAFGTTFTVPKTISWFDAQLIRLGIHPIHGRPRHPQTQGKIERLHGTLERELWPRIRRDTLEHFQSDLDVWRREIYNTVRPHEAIGDRPPLSRFRPSPRPRPEKLPPVDYPPGSIVRKVSTSGDVRWKMYRLLAGRGLVGEFVRIDEQDHEVSLYYTWKKIRTIPREQLIPDTML